MRRAMLLAATILMAGCADNATEEPFKGLVATEHTGILAGVVVDQTITPVEGALVTLLGAGQNITTDEKGRFGIDGLDAGTYRIQVTHPGHLPKETHGIVTAGEDAPPLLTIQIRAVSPNWWIEAFQIAGALESGGALAVAGDNVTSFACCTDYFWNTELTRGSPEWIQSEAIWESNVRTADRMRLTHSSGETCVNGTLASACALDVYHEKDGVSPLILATPADRVEITSEQQLIVSLFSGQEGVPEVVEAGLAVEQPFEMFVHVFYGFAPEDDWSFIHDGSHVTPS